METGTRQIEQLGGLLRRMPWTGLWFLIGAMAISGLPPLNGFASEWLTFQALLFGFRGSADPLVHVLFPVGGALLALTTALAAACFVKAFGMTFVALPRPFGRGREGIVDGDTRSAGVAGRVLRRPWAVPGFVLRALEGVMVTLPGLQPPGSSCRAGWAWRLGWTPSTMWSPSCSAWLFWVRGQPLGC